MSLWSKSLGRRQKVPCVLSWSEMAELQLRNNTLVTDIKNESWLQFEDQYRRYDKNTGKRSWKSHILSWRLTFQIFKQTGKKNKEISLPEMLLRQCYWHGSCYGLDMGNLSDIFRGWTSGRWLDHGGTTFISGLAHWWVHSSVCYQEVEPGCKRCVTESMPVEGISLFPISPFSLLLG